MLRVTVELVPGGVREPRRLGTAEIWNDLEDHFVSDGARGSYGFKFFGRDGRLLRRTGRVRNHARQSLPVWNLVAKVLKEAGYA